jgi:5'-nucleotidase
LTAGVTAGGCASRKKDDQKVPMDRGVTDLAPGKAVPASAVPPDPSYVSLPAAASQPKFVPVDPPAASLAVPASDPMAGISAAPAPASPVMAAPVVTRTPGAPAAPAAPSPAGVAKQYHVQKGDTLFRIAKTHYGDGNRWQQIAMVNPGLTPSTLKAGSTIVVP